MTKLLTAEEVSALLVVPVTWVRAAARNGTLPAIKLGRYWRFDPRAVEAHIGFLSDADTDSLVGDNKAPGHLLTQAPGMATGGQS